MICVWFSINNNNNIHNQITLHGHTYNFMINENNLQDTYLNK